MTLTEAAQLVKDGDLIGLGGMTLYRRPIAFVHELIRQAKKNLTLLAFTGGFESDLLVGAGCVSTVRSCYFGLESFGLAPMFKRRVEAGEVKVLEETESSIAFGLRTGLANVGFMPARSLFGTDFFKVREDIKVVECPYTGEKYTAFPAIRPDVAVIHSQLSDKFGNCILEGEHCVDKELALGAKTTIITAEKIVDTEEIIKRQADIVEFEVNAVVELPKGAHPTSCYPDYPVDVEHILEYIELCEEGKFEEYLQKYVLGVKKHKEYLERVGKND
jgi:glutaconate CoA-transferase subunit A